VDIASTTSPSMAFQNNQQVAYSAPSTSATNSRPTSKQSTSDATPVKPQDQQSQQSTEQAVQEVNKAFMEKQQQLFASIEKDTLTGISVFKIMDKSTNEVVRQLPVKEAVSFAQSLVVPQGWRGQLILDQI